MSSHMELYTAVEERPQISIYDGFAAITARLADSCMELDLIARAELSGVPDNVDTHYWLYDQRNLQDTRRETRIAFYGNGVVETVTPAPRLGGSEILRFPLYDIRMSRWTKRRRLENALKMTHIIERANDKLRRGQTAIYSAP